MIERSLALFNHPQRLSLGGKVRREGGTSTKVRRRVGAEGGGNKGLGCNDEGAFVDK